MDDFPFIREGEFEEYYVKQNSSFNLEVPLIDIFVESQVKGKDHKEIESMRESLSGIETEDVEKAASYWNSDKEVYRRLEREAEAVKNFEEEFEQNGPESFIDEDHLSENSRINEGANWAKTVTKTFSDIQEANDVFDFSISYRFNEGGEIYELEFGDAKVLVGTDSREYVDLAYALDGEKEATLRVHRNHDDFQTEVEERIKQMYNNAVFGLDSV